MIGNLNNFFDSIRNLLNSEEKIKQEIIDLCTLYTSYTPKRETIKIQNGIAYISCHPAVKSELFLKKEKLIEEIKKNTNNKVFDIR